VGGEILHMDLDTRPVACEIVQRHAAFLPGQIGQVAVGGQRDLDDALVLSRHVPGHKQQPPSRLAGLDASCAFPSASKKASAIVTAQAQVSLHLAVPA
jgi:hypothetical protein